MSNGKERGSAPSAGAWTPVQAYVMAVVCLLLGIVVGYLVRGSGAATPDKPVEVAASAQVPGAAATSAGGQITPQQLKQMADKQAEPLLQQLNANPNSPELLASIGNVYYDARQYNDAIGYYERSLKFQPANNDVRTDMGTAYWYLGDADRAISEFQAVLRLEPTKPNTLYNLAVVQWQGKMDANSAVASLQKLLDANPNYENKAQVQELLAQVRKHANLGPGSKTDKPAM